MAAVEDALRIVDAILSVLDNPGRPKPAVVPQRSPPRSATCALGSSATPASADAEPAAVPVAKESKKKVKAKTTGTAVAAKSVGTAEADVFGQADLRVRKSKLPLLLP